MSEASDLIESLKTANQIASLRAALAAAERERDEARELLVPFGRMMKTRCNGYERSPDDEIVRSVGTFGRDYAFISVGDLRRAHDHLEKAVRANANQTGGNSASN